MDRKTYKAGRRMLVLSKLAEMAEGLYGLRLKAVEEAVLEAMFEDPTIAYTADELLEELEEEEE